MIGLLLSNKSIETHHGGYEHVMLKPVQKRLEEAMRSGNVSECAKLGALLEQDSADSSHADLIKKFQLYGPHNQKNCVRLRDPFLLLPLGIIIAKPDKT